MALVRKALQSARAERAKTLAVAGGVAANSLLRRRLKEAGEAAGLHVVVPPHAYCTDNAAMIAWAGLERLRLGLVDGLDFAPRPRWPLEELGSAGTRKATGA